MVEKTDKPVKDNAHSSEGTHVPEVVLAAPADTVAIAEPGAGRFKTVNGHAGRAIAGISIAENTSQAVAALAGGNYDAAATHSASAARDAAIQLVQHKGTWELVGRLAPRLARAVGEKIPVIGGVVALGSGLWETGNAVGSAMHGKSSWTKVGTTAVADAGEVIGSVLGFGLGEVARQGVVEASRAGLGAADTPPDATTVTLLKEAYGALKDPVSKLFDANDPAIAATRNIVHHEAGQAEVQLASFTPGATGKTTQNAERQH